jgi:hypothetical protein
MDEKLLLTVLEKSISIQHYLNNIEFDEIDKVRPLIEERGCLLKDFFSSARVYNEKEIHLLRKIRDIDIEVSKMLENKKKEFMKGLTDIEKGKVAMKTGYLKLVEEIRPQRNFSSEG